MKKSNLTLSMLMAAVGLGMSATAAAAPVIGIDPTGLAGLGSGYFYSSLWTNITDTGVDQGVQIAGSIHTFTTQMAVGNTSNNGIPNTPAGLNQNTLTGFEITKEVKFQDLLSQINVVNGGSGSPNGSTTNVFAMAPNTGNQLSIYLDHLGDGTQAIRSGTGTDCYGLGSTCTAATVATGGINGFDAVGSDGVLILTAKLIANDSSFTSTTAGGGPGTGNGSYNLTFQITGVNSNYVDVSNFGLGTIFTDKFTGTLVQPATEATLGYPPPNHMWDGTLVAGNNFFKVDSSQTFGVSSVPEPTSLALFGIALAGLSAVRRRKSA